jgi:hypothetical protein
MKTLQEALEEASAYYPLKLELELLEKGENSQFGLLPGKALPLPIGNSAYTWRNHEIALVLLDKDESELTNLYNFYHEMGHLMYALQSGRKDSQIEREIDADNWYLQRLVDDGMADLARLAVQRMKDMLEKGLTDEIYTTVYTTITEGKWSSLL